MRIGFSHGSVDGEYEFHLDIHPLVSLDNLKEPTTDTLKTGIFLFRVISDRMNFGKLQGASIQRDLEKLISCFKDEKEASVNIMGMRRCLAVKRANSVNNMQKSIQQYRVDFTLE